MAGSRTWLGRTAGLAGGAGFFLVLVAGMSAGHEQEDNGKKWDIVATSANGAYRLEIRTPEKSERFWAPKDYRYVCYDTKTGRALWEHKQGGGEGSPWSAWVSDAGTSIVRLQHDELWFVDRTGATRSRIDIFKDVFTKEENDKYVHFTTAGRMWGGYSRWYILRAEKASFFCIRTWWHRCVAIDLETARLVPEKDQPLAALNHEEREFVLSELRRGVATLRKLGADAGHEAWHAEPNEHTVRLAAFIAGKAQIKDALPLLQELETSSYSSRSTSSFGNEALEDGVVGSHWLGEFDLRRIAQLSMRRLGASPAGYPPFEFRIGKTSYRAGRRAKDHADLVGRLKEGMQAVEVLRTFGAPDSVHNGDEGARVWEFDVDAREPFTLRLTFGGARLKSIERIKPAVWQQGLRRDEEIVW